MTTPGTAILQLREFNLILISNKKDEPFYYAAGKRHGGKAAKKCRVILFLPP